MSAHFTVIFIGIRYVESVVVKRHWRLLLLLLFCCLCVLPVLLPTWLWRCCPWMTLRTGCWTSWPAAAPLWASRCLTLSMPFVWQRSETGELNHAHKPESTAPRPHSWSGCDQPQLQAPMPPASCSHEHIPLLVLFWLAMRKGSCEAITAATHCRDVTTLLQLLLPRAL